jgi:hypothetical protein
MFNKLSAFLTALLFGVVFSSTAQNSNALSFDGVDDYVSVLNGSSRVVGSTEMSITCWVYPTNAAPAYPNFDGFAGFRNDATADFYLLQVSAGGLEGRFRNSAGTIFTLTKTVLTLNSWQHLALTYDGAELRMYRNGVAIDSVAANGTINAGTVNFNIGNVIFTNASFFLAGRMDETSLWSKALSVEEINCLKSSGIDTSSAGLELYYKFNQGVANANNTSITSLTDSKGNINGTFNAMALTGTTSNFVTGASLATNVTAFLCPFSTYVFGVDTLSTPGVYFDTLTTSFGCDSIVQLNLVPGTVDTIVFRNGGTLTANLVVGVYQWVDCNNGFAIIPGATARNFTPTINGSYACVLTQGGCTDTSRCVDVTNVGLNSIDGGTSISVYPQITNSSFHISIPTISSSLQVLLYDNVGKLILNNNYTNTQELDIDISAYTNGIYLLNIISNNTKQVFRIVKQ